MQKSYTKNYLKIYVTQAISIVVNLLSLVIVIPYLSNDAKTYGIYSLCVSFLIFLSYADLGFLNAGYKYASEYYAKQDKKREIEITGFVGFVLLFFVIIFALAILILSYHPYWLIKNISEPAHIKTARNLLLILALFSPNMVLQRMLQIIFGVRVQDFIYQKILIIISILKISSVFLFTSKDHYNIVGYFLFCQTITAIGLIGALLYASKKYAIPIKMLLLSIKFSKSIFISIKDLAFSTLFFTITWVLFYELDPYVIAKLSGAEAVAIYSIGLTCQAFFRSIFGSLFSPFNARFNHFIALKDYKGLMTLCKTVLCVLLPAVVFPVITLALLSKPFVFSWVGSNFSASVKVVTLLSLGSIMAFISLPSGLLAIGLKKTRLLYSLSIIKLITYWLGIALLFPYIGYIAFAYFELTCFFINGIVYTVFLCNFLKINLLHFLKIVILPAVLPIIILISFLLSVRNYLPLEKGKLNLLEVVATGVVSACVAIIVYYFTSPYFKNYTTDLVLKIKQRILRTFSRQPNSVL
jgi:O-antigen/teichoic acid export membrane protein